MRILVVEDYQDTARVITLMLRKVATSDVAASFVEALNRAKENVYDLFLVDIQLGVGPTGVDLLHELRKDPRYASTPIVACTADLDPEHRDKHLRQGFDGFLGKPFRKQDLLDVVQQPHGTIRIG